MPGPTRKPAALRVIAGTSRADRDAPAGVDLPLVDDEPPPPDWLPNAHAVKEWERLVPILTANNLLTTAALSTLGHLCSLHGKIVQLWAAGEAPTGHMLAQYNALAAAFGLAPSWAGKVKPSAEGEKKNGFAKFKK